MIDKKAQRLPYLLINLLKILSLFNKSVVVRKTVNCRQGQQRLFDLLSFTLFFDKKLVYYINQFSQYLKSQYPIHVLQPKKNLCIYIKNSHYVFMGCVVN